MDESVEWIVCVRCKTEIPAKQARDGTEGWERCKLCQECYDATEPLIGREL